ncbi:Glycoside hydrolase, superfamily [Niveomyces insectorum RCEF 264]|uniref:Glycoside hydrolase, superfamily n=1 Tax=Niveomyces insectorum RCEF 264 TaxID=1081102 RepID=A0A167LTT8_9HYPO|nr:Glycoside hydrolase, superfamily [Niveomyces insectorum RCEF 264]
MERRPRPKAGERDRKTTLGCLFLMGFEGTTVTPQIRSLIEEYRLGAVILNATNFVSTEQAIMLIRELQITAHAAGHAHPLLIAVDQENGLVQSLADPRWITQFPSSLGLAATTQAAGNSYAVALATGRELACVGVNWVLGPSVDVVLDRTVAGLGARSFGDDPVAVAQLGAAFIRGLRDAGVASLAKHFPLGGSLKFDESAATTVPVVLHTLEQLRQKIMVPFQEAIREDVDAVMAAGCAISSVGPKLMHACFSKKVVTDLLRQQLGYGGVTVSECLEIESIANHIGVGQAAVMGIHAGCDVLTICQSLPAQLEALAALSLALDNGALAWALVQKSADRDAVTLVRDDRGVVPLTNVLSANSVLVLLSPLLHQRNATAASASARLCRSGSEDWSSNSSSSGGGHPPRRRRLSATTHRAAHLQYGEDYFQNFGRALAGYNVGDVVHTSYTAHGVRGEHETLIERADAIVILVADANRNQYQLGFAKHVAALSQLHTQHRSRPASRPASRTAPPPVILVSLGTAYDIAPTAPFSAHLCTYDCSATALACLVRVLGGDLAPNRKVPGLQPPPQTADEGGAQREGPAGSGTMHRQAWLVERFDAQRDRVPFQKFLAGFMEDGSVVYGDEEDEGDDGDRNDSDGHAASVLAAGGRLKPHRVDVQHFVIRNTSTGAIYGFASAVSFPALRRGCLGALLVDQEKRELAMGRDLHTSVVRHLAATPGLDTIQLGAPAVAMFPGLPLDNRHSLPTNSEFFEKLGWSLKESAQSERSYVLYQKLTQTEPDGLRQHGHMEDSDVVFEAGSGEAVWTDVLDFLHGAATVPAPSTRQAFCTWIYEEASQLAQPPTIITARNRRSGSLVGSTLLLDDGQTTSGFTNSVFPSLCDMLPATATAILACPVVAVAERPEQRSSSHHSVVVQGLFTKAGSEAQGRGHSSIFVHAVPGSMANALEEIGFRFATIMAATSEKEVNVGTGPASSDDALALKAADHQPGMSPPPPRPKGWIYKRVKVGSWKSTYYASPLFQVVLVSVVLFLDPGMSNALSGLGGGGQLNPKVANNATVASYSTFAVIAFFSGSLCNILGVRQLLVIGGFGYGLQSASFICYNHTGNQGFVIFSGAVNGFCAALLWTGHGTIIMSYPSEEQKGKFFSISWAIFNVGAVLGGLIPLGQNLNGSDASSVGDGTYIAITVLMFCGSLMGLTLVGTSRVIREDGSRVIMMKHPSWQSEFAGLYQVLKTDYFIVLLFPMFFSSNWFYTYQFNDYNLARFDVPTRALNNVVYWAMQILGSFLFGFALDWERFSRPLRARVSWAVLLLLTLAIWGGALKHQLGYTRADVRPTADARMHWTDPGYGSLFVLYIAWGFYDAAVQTSVYWYMGALSNSARKLALYTGVYKSVQSAGNAIVYRLDALTVPYMAMFGIAWGLLLGGLVCAFPLIWFKVTDHTQLSSDLAFSDEKEGDVKAVDLHDDKQ